MPAVIHSCVEAAALFRPYLEGIASESEATSLEEHLKECADCRKAIERRTAYVRMLEEALKGIRVPPKFLGRSDEVLESTKYSQLVEVAGPSLEIEGGDPDALAGMGEEDLPDAEEEEGDDRPFIERLSAAPWWAISGTFHGLLLLLLGLLGMVVMRDASQETVITTDLAKARPPEFDEKRPRDVFRNLVPAPTEVQSEVEHPVAAHEQVQDTSHHET
ncbi:MAG: zf-HC2 domain-containing protein, partial [Planctomycetota bacterium]|nr:zf-HC2 domain-containing protein [Planctomycetota bacterium]